MAGPDLKLGIQPYVRLLKFHYPVDDLVLAVKGGNDESTSFASNGVQDRRKYNEVQAVAKTKARTGIPRRTPFGLLCLFLPHQPGEYVPLGSLRNRRSVQRAIELAFHESAVPSADRASSVQHSFQTWATLGWFCQQDENLWAIKK
jgi:hypothetical protein